MINGACPTCGAYRYFTNPTRNHHDETPMYAALERLVQAWMYVRDLERMDYEANAYADMDADNDS